MARLLGKFLAMNNAEWKTFDRVKCMRRIREQVSEEIADMTYDDLVHWLREHRYSDPNLQRLADNAARF
jgi:hypothetical protein